MVRFRVRVSVRVSVRVNYFRDSFSILLRAQHYSMFQPFGRYHNHSVFISKQIAYFMISEF